MEEFKQRQLFVRKKFTFKDDGVEMYTREFGGDETTMLIQYKDMEPRNHTRIYTEKYPKILQSGFILLVISLVNGLLSSGANVQRVAIISSLSAVFGILTVLAYYVLKVKYLLVELENETQMFIILNKPSKAKMNEFVDELYERRKNNYRENYFYINYDNEKEKELGKMNWLLGEGIISQGEYDVVVDEINEKFVH